MMICILKVEKNTDRLEILTVERSDLNITINSLHTHYLGRSLGIAYMLLMSGLWRGNRAENIRQAEQQAHHLLNKIVHLTEERRRLH